MNENGTYFLEQIRSTSQNINNNFSEHTTTTHLINNIVVEYEYEFNHQHHPQTTSTSDLLVIVVVKYLKTFHYIIITIGNSLILK